MNLFRSEEHIEKWLGRRKAGATISLGTLSQLAHAWWSDRLSEHWRPHTLEQNQQILESIGLAGDFWRLA